MRGVASRIGSFRRASVDSALARARQANGVERILVNCAGIAPSKRTVSKKRETGEFVPHDLATFRRIDIDRTKLPSKEEVNGWSSDEFVSALRHDASNPGYNLHLRQLLHVGFKVAAKMGERYLDMLKACEATVSKNVTENLYERHMKPLFIGNGNGN